MNGNPEDNALKFEKFSSDGEKPPVTDRIIIERG